jgi:acyl carrier protein
MTAEPQAADRSRAELTEVVTGLLAQMVGRPAESLSGETRIAIDLGLTSVKALELLMRLENELGIEIDGASLTHGHLETVASLTAFICERTAEPRSAAL